MNRSTNNHNHFKAKKIKIIFLLNLRNKVVGCNEKNMLIKESLMPLRV